MRLTKDQLRRLGPQWRRRLDNALCTLADAEPLFRGNDHSKHDRVFKVLQEAINAEVDRP